MQFNILQNDPNLKHISSFFKILTILWAHEEYVENFEVYISQLNNIMDEVIKLDDANLKNIPNIKRELMKLFFILKGIVNGLTTSRHFSLFYDWFFPDNFAIITKALNGFIHDDEMVLIIFKFIGELVNNRCSRLRFDNWNINGLIVFKEAAKISI